MYDVYAGAFPAHRINHYDKQAPPLPRVHHPVPNGLVYGRAQSTINALTGGNSFIKFFTYNCSLFIPDGLNRAQRDNLTRIVGTLPALAGLSRVSLNVTRIDEAFTRIPGSPCVPAEAFMQPATTAETFT
ncbi:hypothetical protein Hdeb2414_s0012g00395731 [Helianthus debilis subsp. tardiflorus]